MTRLLWAAALANTVLLAACTSPDPRDARPARAGDEAGGPAVADPNGASGPADPARTAALPASCDDLAEHILRLRPTRAALRAEYGVPDSASATAAPNRHVEGVVDSLFVVHYPGLRVSIHKPGGGSDLVSHVVAEDNRYLAYPRIGIGAPADSVVAALGEPWERGPDAVAYNCGIGADQPVRFELRDGRVRRVVVEYYVD